MESTSLIYHPEMFWTAVWVKHLELQPVPIDVCDPVYVDSCRQYKIVV